MPHVSTNPSTTGTVLTVPNVTNPNTENIPSADSGGLSPLGPRHISTNPSTTTPVPVRALPQVQPIANHPSN